MAGALASRPELEIPSKLLGFALDLSLAGEDNGAMKNAGAHHNRSTIGTILRAIGLLPGLTLQLLGMLCTFLGWLLMATGIVLRVAGAMLSGFLIVTRGLVRAVNAARA